VARSSLAGGGTHTYRLLTVLHHCRYEGGMRSLDEIRDRLQACPPVLAEPGARRRAAVALVVCDAGQGPELLFIERAEHDQDPWSGHLGFPGGRVEPGDPGPKEAAEREAREELGLYLAGAEYLGRLDDLPAAHLPVVVSCFVYGLWGRPALTLNRAEVADAFWFPLADLIDPGRRREETFPFQGEAFTYPAIGVLDPGRPLLWGITYRLVARFLEVMGCPL